MATPVTIVQKTIRLALLLVALCTACATPATPPSPTPTPTAAPPTATPTPDLGSTLDAMLAGMTEHGFFAGAVLVAREGQVVLSQGYGLADRAQQIPNTPQTKFRLGTLTKQFTAMGILMLAERGQLDLQGSVCPYVPDCPEAWQGIFPHDLMIEGSGLQNVIDTSKAVPAGSSPIEHAVFLFRDDPLLFTPATHHDYSNPGYVLLAYLIEQISGQSYEAFLRENIFEPLGMTHTGQLENLDGLALGYAYNVDDTPIDPPVDVALWGGAIGLYSTVEDLLLWDQALYTERLLPQATLKQMFWNYGFEGFPFGYGWMIDRNHGETWHYYPGTIDPGNMPGTQTQIERYVDGRVTVIVLSNSGDAQAAAVADLLGDRIFAP